MNPKNNLQKMLLISPKVYEKIKHLILANERSELIDCNLKKVLKDKKLSEYDRWSLFKHNQLHQANSNRINNYGSSSIQHKKTENVEKSTIDAATNTRRKILKPAQTDSNDLTSTGDIGTQTDINSAGNLPEQFFESLQDPNNIHDASAEADSEYDFANQTLDYSDLMREEALRDKPKNVRIISKLQSRDPKRYALYELSDGTDMEILIPGKSPKTATRAQQRGTRIKLNSPLGTNKRMNKKQSTPKKKLSNQKEPAWEPFN